MYETRVIEEQSNLNANLTVIRNAENVAAEKVGKDAVDKMLDKAIRPSKKKVAAYCRVSTDLEVQESSLELQMEAFSRVIASHADWELAGIYADEGLSGTQSERRIEFQRMMASARKGNIDMILVKSVSRFARNTEDSLRYTRELANMGVGVYFEKEGIDTSAFGSEFMLTIFAAFAQEESHSISENIKRGLRNRLKLGEVPWHNVYGYRKGWVIEESEADVVRRIFRAYADGQMCEQIAKDLNAAGIPSPRNRKQWTRNVVNGILRNEKYVGDALLQKTYVENFMTHKRSCNFDAKIDKYYKQDNHEGIVDRETFNTVQRILTMQSSAKGAMLFPYYNFLKCPCCGKPMVKVWIAGTVRQAAWTCGGDGPEEVLAKRTDCPTYLLQERVMERTIKTAVLGLKKTDNKNRKCYKAIFDAQTVLKNSERLEFRNLRELVEEISLDDWETLSIKWKMGWTGKYMLDFTKAAEAVMPDFQLKKKGVIAGFPMNNRRAFLEGFSKRQENALKTRVIDPEDESGAPMVLRWAE